MFYSLFLYHNNIISQSITAKYNLHVVDSLVYTISPNAKLRLLMSDSVFVDGTSLNWNYQYDHNTDGHDTSYYVHSSSDSVVYDSLNQTLIPGIMYIDSVWIDSDSALVLAEKKGGKDFRINHEKVKISACLEKPYIWDSISTNRWLIYYISLDNPSDKFFLYIKAAGDSIVGIKVKEIHSTDFILHQNYPNPFNHVSKINYSVILPGKVSIIVYDVVGNEVATLVNEENTSGYYSVDFDGSGLSSGIYFYRMSVNDFSETKKMILLR